MIDFLLIALISALGTHYVMPHSIRKLKENKIVAKDMYKLDMPSIPTNAGMIVLFTSFISISIFPLVSRIINFFFNFNFLDISETNLAILLVISIYAIYGLIDDLVDIGRTLKLILPICFSFPLISVIRPEILFIPFYGDFMLSHYIYRDIQYGDIFRLVVIPLYVMVVSNLVNMHSGYNGLQSGLSIIILTTLFIASWLDNTLSTITPFGSFLGAMLVFWKFNKYPSRVFEGNIGSLLFGSLIGSLIVSLEYWWFGFFILIPHTFNFLLWVIWLIQIKINPEEYLTTAKTHQKFGKLGDNGNIIVPNRLTLKWIPNYYYKINEPQTVHINYIFTIFFCVIGLFLFIL